MNKSSLIGLPFLPIWIAPFLLLSPLLLTGKAMFWGTPSLQFVPWRALAWDLISSGELPLWNSLVGMGAPLLANYQSALLYPPNWSLFLLDALGGVGWAAWGQAVVVLVHLGWAGTGIAFLVRRLGMGILSQTICGLAFGLSGYLVARSGFLSINAAVAWLPWILLVVLKIIVAVRLDRRQLLKYIMILSLVLAMQLLTGHAQTTWYTLLLTIVWAGYWYMKIGREYVDHGDEIGENPKPTTSVQRNIGSAVRPWLWLSLALLVACALAAGQLLPTFEYLLQSQRAGIVDYEYAIAYSFWPWRFVTFLAPDMFGSPVIGDYWGYGNYWEDHVYIGLLAIILSLAAIIHSIKLSCARKKPLQTSKSGIKQQYTAISVNESPKTYSGLTYFLTIIVLVSFIIALGKNTPVFPWLYHHVPTFSLFQAPTRFSIWAEVSLVLLVGLGIEIWHRPVGRALYWTRLATAGAFAISVGAGLAWLLIGDVSPTFIRATAITGFLGVVIGILTLTAPESRLSEITRKITGVQKIWVMAVVFFVMLDLLIAGWGLIPGIEQEFYTNPAPNAEEIRSQLFGRRLYLLSQDEYNLKFDRFMRFDTFDPGEGWHNLRAAMVPNLYILDRIPSVNNFDPLVPNRYARWLQHLETFSLAEEFEEVAYLLNLMGVGMVEVMDQNTAYGVSFNSISGGTRVRWVPCVEYTRTGEESWDWITENQQDFEIVVVLEGEGPPSDPDCTNFVGAGQIFNISDNANRQVFRVAADAPGWLVLSDVWYPGWRAYVDGVSVSIYRANYLFRAVQLSAGTHEVEIVYRPTSFWLGSIVSLVTWIILIALWLVYRRRYGIFFN